MGPTENPRSANSKKAYGVNDPFQIVMTLPTVESTTVGRRVRTLQRDFIREFGQLSSQWRTRLRLSTTKVLLETESVAKVAVRVG